MMREDEDSEAGDVCTVSGMENNGDVGNLIYGKYMIKFALYVIGLGSKIRSL